MSSSTLTRTAVASVFTAAALVAGTGVAVAAFGFDDVKETDTHAPGIQWAASTGVTAGCDADSYCPEAPVTRAQMATFLRRLSGTAAGVAPTVDAKSVGGVAVGGLVQKPRLVTKTMTLTNDSFENVSVACDAGEYQLGGGYQIKGSENGGISEDWFAAADGPAAENAGWSVSLRTLDGANHDAFVTVYVNCAK